MRNVLIETHQRCRASDTTGGVVKRVPVSPIGSEVRVVIVVVESDETDTRFGLARGLVTNRNVRNTIVSNILSSPSHYHEQ